VHEVWSKESAVFTFVTLELPTSKSVSGRYRFVLRSKVRSLRLGALFHHHNLVDLVRREQAPLHGSRYRRHCVIFVDEV
jgi:hypothetical protein